MSTINIPGITPGPSIDWIYDLATDLTWKGSGETDEFDIYYWTIDDIGSTSTIQGPHTFIFDVTRPTATITNPSSDGEYLNADALAAISGTVDDIVSYPGSNTNIALIEIAMSSNNPTADDWSWWNGSSFAAESAVYYATATWDVNTVWSEGAAFDPTAVPNETWEFTRPDIGAGQMENDKTYTILIRVTDKAGNVRTMPERYFTFDTDEPTLGIAWPDTNYLYDLSMTSGTVDDTQGAGAIDKVEVAFSTGATDDFNDAYWNGTYWPDDAGEIRMTASAISGDFANGWKLENGVEATFPDWSMLHDKTVRIEVWATDDGGTENAAVYKTTVTFDVVGPTTTVIFPGAGSATGTFTQFWGNHSEDVSDMNHIWIAIRNALGDYWDGGSGFGGCALGSCWNEVSSVESSSWTMTIATSVFTTNNLYHVGVRGQDTASNVNRSTMPPTANEVTEFRFDNVPAVSVTTFPVDGTAYGYKFTAIYGTVDDDVSGGAGSQATEVKIRLHRSDDKYWGGLGVWDQIPQSINFPLTQNNLTNDIWDKQSDNSFSTYTTFSPDFEGYLYDFQTRSKDGADNFEIVLSTVEFVIDFTSPTINSIITPADGGFVTSIATFTGIAEDASPNASPQDYEAGLGTYTALQSIQVAIRRLSDGNWWEDDGTPDFTQAGADPYFNYGVIPTSYQDATTIMGVSSGTWEYYIDESKLTNNTSYYILVKAKDLAGNTETVLSEGGVNKSTFTVDTSTPTTAVGWPNADTDYESGGDYEFQTLAELSPSSGTTSDVPIGQVDVVSLRYIRDDDGDPASFDLDACWDGTAWQTSCGDGIWIDSGTVSPANCTSDCTWSYTIPAGFPDNDMLYRVTARAKDKAGNIHGGSLPDATTYHWQFRFDAPAPVTGISNLSDLERVKPDQLDQILGTSINTVKTQVRIVRLSDDQAWDQDTAPSTGAWVAGPNYWNVDIDTGAGGNW
ncbi:Ig-like domain repeat protein, partial [Elusimicrobiota bacterium]